MQWLEMFTYLKNKSIHHFIWQVTSDCKTRFMYMYTINTFLVINRYIIDRLTLVVQGVFYLTL